MTLTRDDAIRIFVLLDDAGFDCQINGRANLAKLAPPNDYPIRATVRPCDGEQLRKLEGLLAAHDLDYRADSLSSVFGNGVTFNIFPRGARSIPV